MMRAGWLVLVAGLAAAAASMGGGALSGCGPEKVVLHRDNCNVCHQPLDDHGIAAGLESAHPWFELSCVECHGGQPRICDGEVISGNCMTGWVYDKERAHVAPNGAPSYLKNLSASHLDLVDPAYLQFVNPGDYRVAEQTCGGGSMGSPCHGAIVQKALRSSMAHTSGEVAVARYRAGKQEQPLAEVGAVALTDATYDPTNE